MNDVIRVNFIPSGTVEYGQLNTAPYSNVALHTFSVEQVYSCGINVGILFFISKYTTSLTPPARARDDDIIVMHSSLQYAS